MSLKRAFVFPGQGSQSVGMMNFLSDNDLVKKTFYDASLALGYDLWDLVHNGPEEKLNQTEYSQPALLAAGVAMWRLCLESGVCMPDYLAGHSLGEYTALACAGAISLEDAVLLVAKRGRLMQNAVAQGSGAMAAVLGLGNEQIEELCQANATGEVLQAANFNAPGQVVIAGGTAAIQWAANQAKELGAKRVVILPVSVPSHCKLMLPAAEEFKPYLVQVSWQKPKIPVVHNVDLAMHDSIEDICTALVLQLYKPVRWVETILKLVNLGVTEISECGPGKVLTSLNKRIHNKIKLISLAGANSLVQFDGS